MKVSRSQKAVPAMSYKVLRHCRLSSAGEPEIMSMRSLRHLHAMRLSGVAVRRDWLHSLGSR